MESSSPSAPVAQTDRAGLGPWLALAGLFALTVLVYALLGTRQDIPKLNPDEFVYGRLARAVADGDGLTWDGVSQDLRAALYIYLVAPAWKLSSMTDAYAAAKVIGAVMVATVVLPTWLLARRYVSPWLALVPAALVVAGTWMVVTTSILTENLAFPLATVALTAMVPAIERPGSRWAIVALAAAVLAAAARMQLAILFAVLLLALLLDLARHGRGWRARAREHRVLLGVLAAVCVAGALYVLTSKSSAFGSYGGLDITPSLGELVSSVVRQSGALLLLSGVIPVVCLIGLSLRRESWRDARVGPLLAVTWAAVVVVTVHSGWGIVGFGFDYVSAIERYVMYPLPLLLVATVVAGTRVVASRTVLLVVSAILGLLVLVLGANVQVVAEELAKHASAERIGDLVGGSQALQLALATLLLGGAAAFALSAAREGSARALLLVSGTLLVAFLVQDQVAWKFKHDNAAASRAGLPRDLQWVDHSSGGRDVARLVGTTNSPRNSWTEFFNRRIHPTYIPEAGDIAAQFRGGTCGWGITTGGALRLEEGCPPAGSRFLLDDDFTKFTFHGQRVISSHRGVGRVVDAGGAPRLLAQFVVPCGPRLPRTVDAGRTRLIRTSVCATDFSGRFFLDRPATLRLRFRGGRGGGQVTVGTQTYDIAPGQLQTLSFRVPAEDASFAGRLNWSGNLPSFPELVSATLERPGARVELLY